MNGLTLLIPLLTLVPMVVGGDLRGLPANLAVTGIAVAFLFALLGSRRGVGPSERFTPVVLTLLLVALAVALLVVADLPGVLTGSGFFAIVVFPALLLSIFGLWRVLKGREPLTYLVFVLATLMVAGSVTGAVSPLLAVLVGVVVVLGWPLLERVSGPAA